MYMYMYMYMYLNMYIYIQYAKYIYAMCGCILPYELSCFPPGQRLSTRSCWVVSGHQVFFDGRARRTHTHMLLRWFNRI